VVQARQAWQQWRHHYRRDRRRTGHLGRTAFLGEHPDFAVRATGTAFGHTMETQFPLGLALAALSISRGALFPPNDPTGLEVEMSSPPTQIVVIGTGHWRGEGMALVEAIK
jgi:3-oxoacyl-[acyl-carrier-protein] synthase II